MALGRISEENGVKRPGPGGRFVHDVKLTLPSPDLHVKAIGYMPGQIRKTGNFAQSVRHECFKPLPDDGARSGVRSDGSLVKRFALMAEEETHQQTEVSSERGSEAQLLSDPRDADGVQDRRADLAELLFRQRAQGESVVKVVVDSVAIKSRERGQIEAPHFVVDDRAICLRPSVVWTDALDVILLQVPELRRCSDARRGVWRDIARSIALDDLIESIDLYRERIRGSPQAHEMTAACVIFIDALDPEHRIVDVAGVLPREHTGAEGKIIRHRHIHGAAKGVPGLSAVSDPAAARLHSSAQGFGRWIDCYKLDYSPHAA